MHKTVNCVIHVNKRDVTIGLVVSREWYEHQYKKRTLARRARTDALAVLDEPGLRHGLRDQEAVTRLHAMTRTLSVRRSRVGEKNGTISRAPSTLSSRRSGVDEKSSKGDVNTFDETT